MLAGQHDLIPQTLFIRCKLMLQRKRGPWSPFFPQTLVNVRRIYRQTTKCAGSGEGLVKDNKICGITNFFVMRHTIFRR
ncbi:hypothetical protein LMG28140_00800 [Paraburkholderia metrosideri]|uniref:Uncharacterized protein n=1 Tax=Paraburkholderia metrosideri TaxID=580937 RepID=A0ABN7HFW5_9BURK|nr:hypothetical protein LMG28140_00800 [Paraburkholderia metrosideri]